MNDAENVTVVRQVELARLQRDPTLPPRILRPEQLDALAESMGRNGLLQPIVVRLHSGGDENCFVVVGYRRLLAAHALGWQSLPVIVRNDLTDQQALLLAFESEDNSEPRPLLETAWYYARLAEGVDGTALLQKAISGRENVSEAKVSMYVNIGRALTPERITATGIALSRAAELPITLLRKIAKLPDSEIDAALLTATASENRSGSTAQARSSNFAVKTLRTGAWRVEARAADTADWSSEERRAAIESLAPVIADARVRERLEDPDLLALRTQLVEEHRCEVIALREAYLMRIESLSHEIAELSRALHHDRSKPRYGLWSGSRAFFMPRLAALRTSLTRTLSRSLLVGARKFNH